MNRETTRDSSSSSHEEAIGEDATEQEMIEAFHRTRNPRLKASLAESLAKVGTLDAYRALAMELRTPLIDSLGTVMQTPVRQVIARELLRAFPEIGSDLYPNSEEGYARIEAFCERQLGTKWKTERPPIEYSGPLEHGYHSPYDIMQGPPEDTQ